MVKKINVGKINQREILRKVRRKFHKPTQIEKDKRRGRGKERQAIKSKLKKETPR